MAHEALGGDYEIVFNGIEVDNFIDAAATKADGPTIAYVGRHEPRKGLNVLLEAMARLPQNISLWVMSDGPQTEELRIKYEADRRLHWLGPVSEQEKVERIKGADVLCVPSLRGESFGIVLLEAMAAGTPVVASDLPGYRNVASTGDEAHLVPPGDPAALADGLLKVIKDADLSARLAESGRKRALEFSMDRLAKIYVDLYAQAIEVERRDPDRGGWRGELSRMGWPFELFGKAGHTLQ
jgi:phosphatidylinositol alpha-mannosyltransferase